jgi:valyl-tRNA synthetase
VSNEELEKTYSSQEVESKWYPIWEKEGYFKPRPGKTGEAFTIIMPPPNVTGRLHAGHALDVTTQDALIRFKRMKGYEALWLPGMDHAGIATQSVVEKMVWKEEKKTRHDYDREEFVKKIWKWKEEYGGIIYEQQRSLGASPDWDYSTFTMDDGPHKAVNKVFVDLFNEGLIYQSDYIINWDPELQSAISDAEVEHKEVNGAFYHLLYQIKDSDEKVEIATTRPETLLGDTAICVHPEDERFQHLIGKKAIVPLCNREVPILADEYVDIEKGTGCLKVTPGHDFNDFEIGRRHSLPIITILNKDGTLNDLGLEWKGMSAMKARKPIVTRLEELGILIEKKKHVHQVGHGDRSGAVIEPMVSKQWFLDVQEMAKESCAAVDNETTKFYPKQWENTYFSWMREPKNWCLSRQLWWGHQIPVFNCKSCNHQWAAEDQPGSCPKCDSYEFQQDPDVLDTWFSSALWPMSTLGWPDAEKMKEKKYDTFFPTSVLVTGYDIIFFWVARMMMMSLKFSNNVPFEKIYIHAIVRDKLGRKMSKSLGNGIDPLEMVDQYGADAFRFTLAAGSGYNRGINLDPDRIGGYRNFINKIWNAFRFISPYLEKAKDELPKAEHLDTHEKWILGELNATTKVMNESMEEFRYDDSCQAIYSFVYDKLCSWFIELSKPIFSSEDEEIITQRATVLHYTFRKVVALLHPITPYITEELWTHLKRSDEDLLIVQEYPEYTSTLEFDKEQADMNRFIEVISLIRNLRASVNIKPKDEVSIVLKTDIAEVKDNFIKNTANFYKMARVKDLKVVLKSEDSPAKSIMGATTHTEVFLPLEGVIDLDEQIKRLEKEIGKTQKELDKYIKKSENKKFLDNAPDDVVLEVKENKTLLQQKVDSLNNSLKNFKA